MTLGSLFPRNVTSHIKCCSFCISRIKSTKSMGADGPFGLALLACVLTFLGLRSCRWSRFILHTVILILTKVLCVKFTSLLNWWGHKRRRKPLIISIILIENASLLLGSYCCPISFVWTASFVVKTISLLSVWTSCFVLVIAWFGGQLQINFPSKF